MREADALVLDTLRKGAAADVDPAIWFVVEKQVEEVGVLGLTGTARALVEGLVRKHGSPGDKGYASMHPEGSGGGGGSSKGGGGTEGGAALTAMDVVRLGVDGHKSRKAELEAAASKSQQQIKDAKGGGLQPASEGQFWVGTRNDEAIQLSSHGKIMHAAAIKGGTPRVETTNGATARIKGWKHRDALESGDVVAIPGSGMKTPVYRIDGVSGTHANGSKQYTATPIGKKGKATGKPVTLGGLDLGYNDGAITIVTPVVRK